MQENCIKIHENAVKLQALQRFLYDFRCKVNTFTGARAVWERVGPSSRNLPLYHIFFIKSIGNLHKSKIPKLCTLTKGIPFTPLEVVAFIGAAGVAAAETPP